MSVKFFDSASQMPVVFDKPVSEDGVLRMYVCGPTVYDRGHLGHGRSAVVFDVIRKYFEYLGYEVKFVMNITDIDDKMITRAKERGITVRQLADEITPLYKKDYAALGVKPATEYPHATEYIEAMLDLIEKLDKKGHTYTIEGDGVYYDVSTFADYGSLSGQVMDDLQSGARIAVKDAKRNPQDFVVWKFKKDDETDDIAWDSRWGKGRPGWHIECSAMSWKTLGERFDIHGGGLDLKFPHHECEEAQSVGAFYNADEPGKRKFARYWMHNGFITVDKEKMSKSLNNFFTLKEAFEKFNPQVIRMFYLQTHYRSPINFTVENVESAKNALERLHSFSSNLKDGFDDLKDETDDKYLSILDENLGLFEQALNDDFNLSKVFSVVSNVKSEFEKRRSSKSLSKKDILKTIEKLKEIDGVLGVIFPREEDVLELTDEQISLLDERKQARENKDWQKSDEIRDKFADEGIIVEDTPTGPVLRRSL